MDNLFYFAQFKIPALIEYILFFGYLILFCWIVTKVRFFNGAGFSKAQLIMLFLLKVMAGIFYGWVGIYYGNLAKMVDTWAYHISAKQEYHLLLSDPAEYFRNIFPINEEYSLRSIFAPENSYWNNLKSDAMIKLISLFDIFSGGSYFINVIFYSFITLFGLIACFRLLCDHFPSKRWQMAVGCFLIPSFLYWASGIHKEGLLFLGLMMAIYPIHNIIKGRGLNLKRIAIIFLGCLLIFVFRNFILAILLPALLAWILASRRPSYRWQIYGAVYGLSGLFFFLSAFLSPSLNFPAAVVAKEESFLKLEGGSFVPTQKLEPNLRSFVSKTPEALELTILRPYPSDVMHLLSMAACVETLVLLLLVVLRFSFPQKLETDPVFDLFLLVFSITMLLSIGYTINFLGATVRYRSIVLPFLITPIIARTDWKKIIGIFSK